MSKTPQFDAALDAILAPLTPHNKTCGRCSALFPVSAEDIGFYRMLRVPPPTLCPLCRKIRRFAHLLRLPKFFKKKCEAPGHGEEVITVFPPGASHRVYDFAYWYSDAWDAADSGFSYDSSQKFFPQFQKLFFNVPHLPLERDPKGVGVDYCLGGLGGSNNYLCSLAYATENSAYCLDARFCRDLYDCNAVMNSELCYQSVGSTHCSRCLFVVDCAEALDSAFLYDCKNCSHCFMSSNLRNRSYVFCNEQVSKDEYEKRLAGARLSSRTFLEEHLAQFQDTLEASLHRSVQTHHSSASVGDYLSECSKCFWCFRANKAENVRYSDILQSCTDSIDATTVKGDRAYECVVNDGSRNLFSMYMRTSTNLEYSSECHNCHYCFGCVGLKNKRYHIFNRPYSEEEYWKNLDGIKTRMLRTGEYGEFFPLSLGLTPYQNTYAQKDFPLSEAEAKRAGIPWYDEPLPTFPSNMKVLKVSEVPDDLHDIRDDILECALICEKTGKPFRLVPSELSFYKRMGIPVPTVHPFERMMERVQLERPPLLYPFTCPRCRRESFAAYSPEEQSRLRILCEPCYLKETV